MQMMVETGTIASLFGRDEELLCCIIQYNVHTVSAAVSFLGEICSRYWAMNSFLLIYCCGPCATTRFPLTPEIRENLEMTFTFSRLEKVRKFEKNHKT